MKQIFDLFSGVRLLIFLMAPMLLITIAIDIFYQEKLRKLLIQIVPGFKPQCEISDILYQDKL
jgi:hypothetical protein